MTDSYADPSADPYARAAAPAETGPLGRAQQVWAQLGGKLGSGVCLLGFLVIFVGWNGAASFDRVPSQFPYLISGGLAGLALCIIGAALLVIESQRADRARLEAAIHELRAAVEASAGAPAGERSPAAPVAVPAGHVVVGSDSFHASDCRLIAGRPELETLPIDEAEGRGLTPCRICHPSQPDAGDDEPTGRRRQLRAR